MSRQIGAKPSVTITEEESASRRTDAGKLLFTAYQGRDCALWIQEERLAEAVFCPQDPGKIGAIYIGKVKNLVPNIAACFVEIGDRELCFMPLKNAVTPFLLNRAFDGRILEGDELLVQVERDAWKTKQAAVTAHISIANDCFAIALGSARAGYSAKLGAEEKEKLRKLLTGAGILENARLRQDLRALLTAAQRERLAAEGMALGAFPLPSMGVVVRTRAGEQEAEEVLESFFGLSEQFVRLLYTAMHRSCFTCMREPGDRYEDILRRFARQASCGHVPEGQCAGPAMGGPAAAQAVQEIVTDQEPTYERLRQYCELHKDMPRVRLYRDERLGLAALYSISGKLEEALGSRVWLKSGGYLVIEPTEALTVIDVNSGKYEAGKDAEETYRRVNMEAAREVAWQLRLRNLSGIIIVDFINMKSAKDQKALVDYLRELTAKDSVLTRVIGMTGLGLVELTRKRTSRPLREQYLAAGAGAANGHFADKTGGNAP